LAVYLFDLCFILILTLLLGFNLLLPSDVYPIFSGSMR